MCVCVCPLPLGSGVWLFQAKQRFLHSSVLPTQSCTIYIQYRIKDFLECLAKLHADTDRQSYIDPLIIIAFGTNAHSFIAKYYHAA